MRPTFDEHEHRGEWHRRRRGGRMRRGEIRTALLAVLAEEPGHGYEIMQRLEEKSGGAWRPSPGSVYPTLQMLEDEGLVRSAYGQLREGARGIILAARQISHGGDESQVQRAADLVREARKQLYRILAED